MAKGKAKCKALKELRKKIADENDIEFAVRECSHQGDCLGTCPMCEAELKYLEQQLAKRNKLGKKIAVVGIAAGLTGILGGCEDPDKKNSTDGIWNHIFDVPSNHPSIPPDAQGGEAELPDYPYAIDDDDDGDLYVLDGDVAPIDLEED